MFYQRNLEPLETQRLSIILVVFAPTVAIAFVVLDIIVVAAATTAIVGVATTTAFIVVAILAIRDATISVCYPTFLHFGAESINFLFRHFGVRHHGYAKDWNMVQPF